DHYKVAFEVARRAHFDQLAAETAVYVLGSEIEAVSDPSDAHAWDNLATTARQTIKAAGDDPHYTAMVEELDARVDGARGRFDDAIAKYDRARTAEVAIHNFGFATRLAGDEAMVMLRRDRPGDVDAVWARLQEAEREATNAKIPDNKLVGLRNVARFVAQL